MKKFSLINVIFLLIVPIILGSFWFKNGNIMGTGESGLPFFNLKKPFEIVSHTWATPLLGGSVGIQVGAIPTDWVLFQLQDLGIPGFVIQALFFIFLFVVAGSAIYFLTQELFPNLKKIYILPAVWFYWFNPISLVSVWNRFLYNYMIFWALLPLALWLFLKGLKTKDYRFAILTALSTAIAAYALTAVAFDVLIFFLLTYTLLFFFFLEKNKVFCIKYFVTFLLGFVFLNFWWIAQLFSFVLSSSYTTSVSQFFTSNDNLSTVQALSERLGLLANIFALLHYDFFANGSSWAKLFVSPTLIFLNLLVMVLILWIIFKFRRNKEVIFLGLFLTVVVFLMKGINPPFGEIYRFIFLSLPSLQVFRNPFEKFSFLLPLVAAPLFGLAVENLIYSVKAQILKFLIWIFLIGIMGFWSYPFWTGLIFTGYATKVPDYYREVNDWLKDKGGDFRFVSLPLGGEGMTYTWDKPYSGVELSASLFNNPNISFNTSQPYFSELASNLTKYQLDKRILEYFPFINGKYIVWRNDVDFKSRRIANPLIIKGNLDQMIQDGLISLRYDGNSLRLYELTDKFEQWPKIYISSNLIWSNDNDLVNFKGYKNFFNEKFVIVNSRNMQPENTIIKPTRIIASFDPRNKLIPRYNFPKDENHLWIAFQFEVPYMDKYKIQMEEKKGKFVYYLDGEKITDADNPDNYYPISGGFHELIFVGESQDFLTPVVNFDKLHLNFGDNGYVFNLPITPTDYLIQFNYSLLIGNILSQSNRFYLAVFEDISNANNPSFVSEIIPNDNSSQFKNWVGYYSSTPGATTSVLSFVPNIQNVGRFSIDVDNLKVSQVDMPDVYLVTQQQLINKPFQTSLEWEKINPTLYNVRINKQDSQPEILVFSELFDPRWEIKGKSYAFDNSKHMLVNSYANGWLLDKPGKYEINLEFMPERLLHIGKIISGSAVIICLTILLLAKLKRRK